jgi:endothelin-converting enzyme/putative endopeptidase
MKIKLNKGLLLAIPAMIVFAESQAQTVTSSKEPGINVSFDNTVNQQIIFRFVNGTWLDKTEIPVIELHGKF